MFILILDIYLLLYCDNIKDWSIEIHESLVSIVVGPMEAPSKVFYCFPVF